MLKMKKVYTRTSCLVLFHVEKFLGNTPLHEACFFGREYAVNELLQAGASWKFVNKLGWTSLHVD